ncbi:MAG: 1,4-dihydroxy-2-naphthoate octaprenyltransferase [Bacteroidia bacterium]|nr:1,4-dihydroxy-2-naphthoate octaprenyltransferase [Bacteroidia bacterium]
MISAFVSAARLRTLPLALASIALGSVLSAYFDQHSWSVTVLALTTAILLQILSNFANDYGDFAKGTDTEERTDRALASGKLSLNQMKTALIVTSVLALVSGLGLLWTAFGSLSFSFITLLLVGLLSIGAAIKYTAGKNPYGYKTLGDFAVLIFFGWVAVLGMYYLHNQRIDSDFWLCLLPATSIGLLASGVLNVNNIRDIHGDTANGKFTLAVKMGKHQAEVYQLLLYLVSLAGLIVFLLKTSESPLHSLFLGLFIIPYLLHWNALRSLENTLENRPAYNRLLKLHVLLNMALVLALSFILL